MKQTPNQTKRRLAIYPASLMKDRKRWQTISDSLPPNSYLLVSTLKNPRQTMAILRIGHSLQQCGQRVSVLTI